jgi:hypothetical protein
MTTTPRPDEVPPTDGDLLRYIAQYLTDMRHEGLTADEEAAVLDTLPALLTALAGRYDAVRETVGSGATPTARSVARSNVTGFTEAENLASAVWEAGQ